MISGSFQVSSCLWSFTVNPNRKWIMFRLNGTDTWEKNRPIPFRAYPICRGSFRKYSDYRKQCNIAIILWSRRSWLTSISSSRQCLSTRATHCKIMVKYYLALFSVNIIQPVIFSAFWKCKSDAICATRVGNRGSLRAMSEHCSVWPPGSAGREHVHQQMRGLRPCLGLNHNKVENFPKSDRLYNLNCEGNVEGVYNSGAGYNWRLSSGRGSHRLNSPLFEYFCVC